MLTIKVREGRRRAAPGGLWRVQKNIQEQFDKIKQPSSVFGGLIWGLLNKGWVLGGGVGN